MTKGGPVQISDAGPYARVVRELADSPFAAIEYVEVTDSTNADALALLGNERFFGHTIVAEYQRRGAGRKGRSWSARPGTALLLTTILPRAFDTDAVWIVPYWVALGVRQALLHCGIPTELQWPNDLLLAGRKVAGILCQSRVTGASAHVACGVGINVMRLPGTPDEIEPPPAFCSDAAPVDRAALLHAVLTEYDRARFLLDQPERVAGLWERAAGLPGRRYRILKDSETRPFEATAQSLARGGGLLVTRDDGARETIDLADSRVLR
jgi:BirA family transcriptional regulator, biotin operon repressor / biotin---[acetyl-CoA-carboxylase] ligase